MCIKKILLSMFLVTTLLGWQIGCSKRPSDGTIAKNIETKAAAAPETKDSDFHAAVQRGRVTLTGSLRTLAARQKLQQIARDEPGTTSVDDQTSVQTGPSKNAQSVPQDTPAKPAPQPIIVPAGTSLPVRVGQALGSEKSKTGDTFIATLAQDVNVDGQTAIRRGADITGTVLNAKAKGRIKGHGELSLALTSITVDARPYSIQTSSLDKTIKGKGKRTAKTTGGGAAGGALIGGIAGGGKGAAIGGIIAGGAGFIGGIVTGNKQIEVPVESVLTFQLSAPLTLPPPPSK